MLRQQVLAVLHDHNARGIQLQPSLEIPGVEIIRSLGRDIQQCLIRHRTLDADMHMGQRRHIVSEFIAIEIRIFVVRHVLLRALPDGDHGIERCDLGECLPLGLFGFLRALLQPLLGHLHLDGVADIVRILFNQALDLLLVQEFTVVAVVRVVFELHDNVGAGLVPLSFLDRVTVRAVGLPHKRLVAAVLPGDDRDGLGDHKR